MSNKTEKGSISYTININLTISTSTSEVISNYFNNLHHSNITIQILKLWINSNLEPRYDISFVRDFIAKYQLESRVYGQT